MSDTYAALVIPVMDTPYLTVLDAQTQRRLPEVWDIVGGWFAMIHPCDDPCHGVRDWHAFVGEDADLKGLPINGRASRLAVKAGWHLRGDTLMGPVIFTGCAAPATDCAPVPDALLNLALSLGIRPMRSVEHTTMEDQCPQSR